MFPQRELTELAHRRRLLRLRIAAERSACAAAARSAVRPFRWLDRLHACWRGAPALLKAAAVPLAFLLPRKLFPKKTRGRAWVRWVPLAWRIARAVHN